MLHIALHFIVPLIIAGLLYRKAWFKAFFVMIATMLVDLDHLLAVPIYDPNRCSINFHPLHTTPAIIVYAIAFALPALFYRKATTPNQQQTLMIIHWIGFGLLIHMGLDWGDCYL